MAGKKAEGNGASAKRPKKVKTPKGSKKTGKPNRAKRAAEVEANLGKSQSLHDFLKGAGWY